MPADATDKSRLEQLELEAQRERALQRVMAGLSSAATREEILRSFLYEGSRVLAASAAVAYLLDPGSQTARLVAQSALSDELAEALATTSFDAPTPTARSMRERRPLWLSTPEDLAEAFAELDQKAQHTFERRAVAALPLFVRGEIVGGISFAFPEAHAFERGERDFLTALAERVQAAMERALLLEESQQARAAAERSRAEAEALLRFNEIVSGILAHDLRNPLAAMLMNAHILRSAESERLRAVGQRIITSGERMSRMIDQILEWTRLRTGNFQLTRAPTDLGNITEVVVSEIGMRNAEISIAVESRGDLRGHWDADRLSQVVSNLVANAIEHASRAGVWVTLDGEGPEIRLTVENEGQIDEALIPLIFEPFRGRAAGSEARGKGLGLGLYIARELVRAHGGGLQLEIRAPSRVAFVVTLPRAP